MIGDWDCISFLELGGFAFLNTPVENSIMRLFTTFVSSRWTVPKNLFNGPIVLRLREHLMRVSGLAVSQNPRIKSIRGLNEDQHF